MQLEFPATWQCIHSLMKIAKQAIGIIINPNISKILLLVILSFFGTEKKSVSKNPGFLQSGFRGGKKKSIRTLSPRQKTILQTGFRPSEHIHHPADRRTRGCEQEEALTL
jgi:hypothetical protein